MKCQKHTDTELSVVKTDSGRHSFVYICTECNKEQKGGLHG
jgi:hypothetical protein